MFVLCDLDTDDVINQDEILALNNLRGSHEGKVPFRVTVDETLVMFRRIVGGLNYVLIDKMRAIDADGDGYITNVEIAEASFSDLVRKNIESVFI